MSSVAACAGAASLCFRSVCKEDLDESFELLVDLLKQLHYSLSIPMRDSWLGLRPSQLSRDSINPLAFYHECCSLIGYATHVLFNN